MNFLETHVNKRNVAILNLIAGAFATIFYCLGAFSSNLTGNALVLAIKAYLIVYFLYLILALIEAIAAGFLCIKKNCTQTAFRGYLIIPGLSVIFGLLSMNIFILMTKIMGGNVAMAGVLNEKMQGNMMISIFSILIFLHVILTIYTGIWFFLGKDKVESEQVTDTDEANESNV